MKLIEGRMVPFKVPYSTKPRAVYMRNYRKGQPRVRDSRTGRAFEERARRISARKTVIDYYGGKCACCGETLFEFLAIDHIDGGGKQHRRSLGKNNKDRGGPVVIRWLIYNNFPAGFRVLCHNCNSAIGFYGYCPHKNLGEG